MSKVFASLIFKTIYKNEFGTEHIMAIIIPLWKELKINTNLSPLQLIFVQLICPSLFHEITLELLYPKICIKTIYFVNITSESIASLFRMISLKCKYSTQCKRNTKRKTPQCGPETGLFTLIKRHVCEWDRYSYVSHLFLYVTLFTSLLVCVCNSIYDLSLGKEA